MITEESRQAWLPGDCPACVLRLLAGRSVLLGVFGAAEEFSRSSRSPVCEAPVETSAD